MAGMAFGKGKKGPVAPTPAKGKGGFPFASKASAKSKLKPPMPFKEGGSVKSKADTEELPEGIGRMPGPRKTMAFKRGGLAKGK